MKIEEISEGALKEVPKEELYNLRLRFIQLYSKNFQGNNKQKADDLLRDDLLSKYRMLIREIRSRNLSYLKETPLDRAVFKRAMLGVDVPSLGDFVIVESYVAIGGSFVKSPRDADDVDVIIRDSEMNRDEGLELKVGRLIGKETGKDPHFVYSPRGPHSSYIPLFDLVLRNRSETKTIKIKETMAKLAAAKNEEEYYAGLDDWDETLVKDNYEVIKHLSDGSVLDLGCGTGRLLKLLESSGREVQGVDNNSTALDYCKKKGLNVMRVDLDKDRLPFHSDSFDNVISVHTVEHLKRPKKVIKDAIRVAKQKVLILSPLGERLDPGHKQKFSKIEDFKELFADDWDFQEVKDNNTALAIYSKVQKAAALKPLQRFTPLKMGKGYAMGEHFDIDTFWDKWAKAYVDKGISLAVQKKFAGWRTVLELDAAGNTLIYFEDSKKDRSKQFPDLAKELKTVGKAFILDAEIEALTLQGQTIPRKDLAFWGDGPEIGLEFETPAGIKGRYIVNVFDILYWDGEDLHTKSYKERREQLQEFFGAFDFKIMKLVPEKIVSSKESFIKAIEAASKLPGSEGAVVKTVTGDYPLTGQTPTWAKIKTVVEFKVQVMERIPVKGTTDTFNYRVAYLCDGELKELGKTYNVKLKASQGQVLTITAQEIIPKVKDGKLEIAAVVPGVQDIDPGRKKPETAAEIASRAWKAGILQVTPEQEAKLKELKLLKAEEGAGGEFGNLDFKLDDSGTGVLQIHIMGIEEEQAEALRKASSRVMVARGDLSKLERLLKELLGEQGAHLDLRLRRSGDDYWEGGEIMLGNLSGLSKFYNYKKGQKLRFAWKQSRAGEKKTEIVRGPLSWMDAGQKKVELFPPGETGATANLHGALITLDKFTWKLYLADDHAKKLHVEGSKHFDGNWLFAFVPVTAAGKEGKRVWMVSKLDDDDHEKEQPVEKLTAAQEKEYEEESEKIRENRKKATFPHKFKPAKYTHPNGHPRCIICGDEETTDGMCRQIFKFDFWKVSKRQQVVGGVVYAPDEQDSQGDYTDAAEIEKAMYKFMIKYSKDPKRIKVMHQGKVNYFPVLECFQPEEDTKKGGKIVKAGSWWLMIKVTNDKVWELIEKGKLTGFSMGGQAKSG